MTLFSHHLLFYGEKKRSWILGTLGVALYFPGCSGRSCWPI
ncbi:MAG: hypothetical protein R2864_12340 [Syntrophotaleaceae bacterium]